MQRGNHFLVYVSLFIAMCCWGFTFVWYKQVYPGLSPVTLVTLRLFFATVILLFLSVILKKKERVKRKDLPQLLILTLFEPFIYFMCESYGLKYISSTLASLIVAGVPLIAPVAAWYYFRERLTIGNYIGIVFSLAGVYLVIVKEKAIYESTLAGVLLMILAVFSTIGFSVYAKKLSDKYNPFTIVLYQNFFGLLLFLPIFFLTEKTSFFSRSNLTDYAKFIPVIELAVFGSVIAFMLFIFSVSRIGIAKANVFVNTIPVFTAIFAYFILNESFSVIKIVGILVVISGLFLSQAGHLIEKSKKVSADENR